MFNWIRSAALRIAAVEDMVEELTRARAGASAKRVLLVEESGDVTAFVAALLDTAGYDIAGPVRSIDELQECLAEGPCAGAIVDQSGDGGVAFRAAAHLEKAGVPFLFVGSSCKDAAFPASFKDVTRLRGQISAPEMLKNVAVLTARDGERDHLRAVGNPIQEIAA